MGMYVMCGGNVCMYCMYVMCVCGCVCVLCM